MSDSVEDFGTAAEQFYKQQIENEKKKCSRQSCVDMKTLLRKQIDEMEAKYKNHKDAVEMCAIVIAEKNSEIESLGKLTEHNEPAACSNPQTFNLNFIDFGDNFSTVQLSQLRFIGSTKREDSTVDIRAANHESPLRRPTGCATKKINNWTWQTGSKKRASNAEKY